MKILFVLFVFICFTYFSKLAAGTLSLKKINIVSFAYYNLLIFAFIGSSLVYLGFRDHYLIQKVNEINIDKTYYFISYTLIMFPLTIYLFNRLFGLNKCNKKYNLYLQRKIDINKHDSGIFFLIAMLTLIGGVAFCYMFIKIGYFPLLRVFNSNFSLARERIILTNNFAGNSYIRNILVLTLIPMLSYISYIYMRVTKKQKWKIMFAVLFLLSIICKTYNFEKAPIIYYLFYFYILEIVMGNVKSIKKIIIIGITIGSIILFMYYFWLGYDGNILSISHGPGGRIFLTQIATMFLHVETFPGRVDFLYGQSLPKIIGILFGVGNYGNRSGRVVMEQFNASGIENGTAGVMNTIFSGEAYANWGFLGIIIAPIIVGILYSIVYSFIINQNKNPLLIMVYLTFFIYYSSMILGGFVDFFYNFALIFLVLLFVAVNFIKNGGKLYVKKT